MGHKGRRGYSSLFDGRLDAVMGHKEGGSTAVCLMAVLMQSWATRKGGSTAVCLKALS